MLSPDAALASDAPLVHAELADNVIYATQLGTGIMLLLAINTMRAGHFTVGDFALFVSYLDWLAGLPFQVGRLLSRYKQARISFERRKRSDFSDGVSSGAARRAISESFIAISLVASVFRRITATHKLYRSRCRERCGPTVLYRRRPRSTASESRSLATRFGSSWPVRRLASGPCTS